MKKKIRNLEGSNRCLFRSRQFRGGTSAESTVGVSVSAISVAENLEMEVRNENGLSLNQFYRLGADIIC